jgi:hypothetical protein
MSSNPNQSQKTLLDPTRVVYAWGDGEFGKLGIGQLTGTKTPVRLTTIRGDRVIGLSAGSHNSAFIGGNDQRVIHYHFIRFCCCCRRGSGGQKCLLTPPCVMRELTHTRTHSLYQNQAVCI